MIELKNNSKSLTQLRWLPYRPENIEDRKLFANGVENCKLYRRFHLYTVTGAHQLQAATFTGTVGRTFFFTIIISISCIKCNCCCCCCIGRKQIFRARENAQQQNVNGKKLCH